MNLIVIPEGNSASDASLIKFYLIIKQHLMMINLSLKSKNVIGSFTKQKSRLNNNKEDGSNVSEMRDSKWQYNLLCDLF